MANVTTKDQERQQQENVAEKVSAVEKFFNENKKVIWGVLAAAILAGCALLPQVLCRAEKGRGSGADVPC